ncbi:beta-phosphoglucomutase [Mycoplasma marinum]|uniref:Beta-phosphoglucomutase n=1 Tax=Mycoplasma marinum TaxID=1937190 RepID=A0A4R0XQP0_9MOLU|nr:beta-phosphoglucomutase [Mycoplasma marinum]TCG11195.1 beta-phosphoglucomutase [Mycoplasma marinum]
MIKGFVFDLDGVITETAKLHYKAWKDEVAKVGIEYTEKQNATLKGLPRMETLIGILNMQEEKMEFSEEKMNEMATSKNNNYLEMLDSEMTEKDILPNVKDFLIQAKEAGIKMVIASSSRNAPKILKKIKLIDFFEGIVDPSKIKNGKPSPDIYLEACKLINIKPSEAIGFEDAMPGVVGLKEANIKTVAITWGDKGEWEKADLIIESTKDLNFKEIVKL